MERFPVPGHDPQFLAALVARQEKLASQIQQRIERAGLQHDPACPVILSLFGMLLEQDTHRWTASVAVKTTQQSAMVYPAWDSGMYKTSWGNNIEAQDDLESALLERVQRFLAYFGKD